MHDFLRQPAAAPTLHINESQIAIMLTKAAQFQIELPLIIGT